MKTADIALYRAKAEGRGKAIFFNAAMAEESTAASIALANEAANLKSLIDFFNYGSNTSSQSVTAPRATA